MISHNFYMKHYIQLVPQGSYSSYIFLCCVVYFSFFLFFLPHVNLYTFLSIFLNSFNSSGTFILSPFICQLESLTYSFAYAVLSCLPAININDTYGHHSRASSTYRTSYWLSNLLRHYQSLLINFILLMHSLQVNEYQDFLFLYQQYILNAKILLNYFHPYKVSKIILYSHYMQF